MRHWLWLGGKCVGFARRVARLERAGPSLG
jgi:hypothetical protein